MFAREQWGVLWVQPIIAVIRFLGPIRAVNGSEPRTIPKKDLPALLHKRAGQAGNDWHVGFWGDLRMFGLSISKNVPSELEHRMLEAATRTEERPRGLSCQPNRRQCPGHIRVGTSRDAPDRGVLGHLFGLRPDATRVDPLGLDLDTERLSRSLQSQRNRSMGCYIWIEVTH